MQKNNITKEFCEKIPKIELHAHLNGSVRRSTLFEIAKQKNFPFDEKQLNTSSKDSLSDCFNIFDLIHKTLNDLSSIARITKEILEDFQEDNVIYLEIRTTPKESQDYSYKDYIKTILEEIKTFSSKNSMITRVLLSVNRSESLDKAEKTLELLTYFKENKEYEEFMVGIDYSGNPSKGSFKNFENIFKKAREKGFKCGIHTAEMNDDITLQESYDILNFNPDRIGHFNYFDKKLLELLISKKIPVEVCPT